MIYISDAFEKANSAPTRYVKAKVELYKGSTLVDTFTDKGKIISIDIERTGDESKFFGFLICKKANVKLIDVKRELNITTENSMKIFLGYQNADKTIEYRDFATMDVTEVHRDENTNELSITVYDRLKRLEEHTTSELELTKQETVITLFKKIISFINLDLADSRLDEYTTAYVLDKGVNIEGSETLKELLIDCCEFVQGVGFIKNDFYFGVKRLENEKTAADNFITKNDYFTLKNNDNKRVVGLAAVTSLGNNISTDTGNFSAWHAADAEIVQNGGIFTTKDNIITINGKTDLNAWPAIIYCGDNTTRASQWWPEKGVSDAAPFVKAGKYNVYIKSSQKGVSSIYAKIIYKDSASEGLFIKTDGSETIVWADNSKDIIGVAICLDNETEYSNVKLEVRISRGDRTLTGSTSYVKDNMLYELMDSTEVANLLEKGVDYYYGFTMNQFECDYRCNLCLESADKLKLTTKDDKITDAFCINSKIHYAGSLSEQLSWNYQDTGDNPSNPSTLGDVLNQTKAVVDKVNKQIGLVISATDKNTSELTSLTLNQSSINASVEKLTKATNEGLENANKNIGELTQKVNASMTPENVNILIKEQIDKGTGKVETSTGFKFDKNGLDITKSGSQMSTKITENGMQVSKEGKAVLTANNTGVDAENLHATTYLIIGKNSRFEDYTRDGEEFTACFWIGGL